MITHVRVIGHPSERWVRSVTRSGERDQIGQFVAPDVLYPIG